MRRLLFILLVLSMFFELGEHSVAFAIAGSAGIGGQAGSVNGGIGALAGTTATAGSGGTGATAGIPPIMLRRRVGVPIEGISYLIYWYLILLAASISIGIVIIDEIKLQIVTRNVRRQ